MNKAEFIKSLPATTPAKEVAAKAKSAGLTLDEKYVYSIRSKMRRRAARRIAIKQVRGGVSALTARAVTQREPARPTEKGKSGTEATFKRLFFELGSERAHRILKDLESKVSNLI